MLNVLCQHSFKTTKTAVENGYFQNVYDKQRRL